MLAAVAGDAIQVADGDLVLLETLRGAGYEPVPDSPFDLDVRLATTAMGDAVELPAGYVVRSASPDDDLVAVHRAAWRPADLPFARGHMPAFSTDATSSFDAAKLAAVQAADGYRADLHVVVTAPDGSLAASCIAWFDAADGCRRHRTARRAGRASQPRPRRRDVPARGAARPRRRRSRADHPPTRRRRIPGAAERLSTRRLRTGRARFALRAVLTVGVRRRRTCAPTFAGAAGDGRA